MCVTCLQVDPAIGEDGEEFGIVSVRLVHVDRGHDDGRGQKQTCQGEENGQAPLAATP